MAERISLATFFRNFATVPDAKTGTIASPIPHVGQVEAIAALDSFDAGGLRRYPVHVWHWARKCSKDFMLGVALLHHLACDTFEQEPRYGVIAAWDGEQTQITRRAVLQLIQRHPYLREHFTVYRDTIVFSETRVEARTGGTYTVEHIGDFLTRDTKGSHGLNISWKGKNEHWCDDSYDFEEALTVSPSRRSPVTIYASYYGLQARMKKGTPLFDLLERVRQDDPTIFYSYIGGEGDRAPWKLVPWITERWINEQRSLFAFAPNRFRRMILNVPAGADAGLITSAELRDAVDPTLQPAAQATPGQRYVLAVDLGLSNDWTALVLVTTDGNANAVVTKTQTFRGTPDQPVNLMAVEDAIMEIAARFPLERCIMDAWNAALLGQRLTRRGVPTQLVTTEASRLDRIVTRLKGLFARRQIRLSAKETHLIEQLESVEVIESRIGKRDTLKFAPSGSGAAAGLHDDLVVALGLALDVLGDRVGRCTMDPMPHGCNLENAGKANATGCFLFGGNFVPTGLHKLCVQDCAGFLSTKRAHYAYVQRTGTDMELRDFVTNRLIETNAFINTRKANEFLRDWV